MTWMSVLEDKFQVPWYRCKRRKGIPQHDNLSDLWFYLLFLLSALLPTTDFACPLGQHATVWLPEDWRTLEVLWDQTLEVLWEVLWEAHVVMIGIGFILAFSNNTHKHHHASYWLNNKAGKLCWGIGAHTNRFWGLIIKFNDNPSEKRHVFSRDVWRGPCGHSRRLAPCEAYECCWDGKRSSPPALTLCYARCNVLVRGRHADPPLPYDLQLIHTKSSKGRWVRRIVRRKTKCRWNSGGATGALHDRRTSYAACVLFARSKCCGSVLNKKIEYSAYSGES